MIAITKLKEINQGSLKCVLSVVIEKWGGFVIEDIKLFQNGEARWFHFPNRPYEDEGKKKYFEYNHFQKKEMTIEFQKQLFRAADEYLMNKYNSEIL